MKPETTHSQDYARRSFYAALGLNLLIVILFTIMGYAIGRFGNDERPLSEISQGLQFVHSGAAGNSWWILKNNLGVGLSLTLFNAVPIYGLVAAAGKLGLSLGLLIKSVAVDPSLPSLTKLAVIVPHGVPEYLGFALMMSSVATPQVAVVYKLRGFKVGWRGIARGSLLSLAAGVILVAAAAVIEGYITPLLAERSLWL